MGVGRGGKRPVVTVPILRVELLKRESTGEGETTRAGWIDGLLPLQRLHKARGKQVRPLLAKLVTPTLAAGWRPVGEPIQRPLLVEASSTRVPVVLQGPAGPASRPAAAAAVTLRRWEKAPFGDVNGTSTECAATAGPLEKSSRGPGSRSYLKL